MEPPDRQERAIRFGCGAVFGLAASGLVLVRLGGVPWPWALAFTAAAAAGCGWAADRHGDGFWWEALRGRWWW